MDTADPGETWYFFKNYSMTKLTLLRPFSLFLQTFPTFKDGVLTYEVAPQREDGGKKHIYKMYIQGDELIAVRI